MENTIELPLGEAGMRTLIGAVADAMTYEATIALMDKITAEDVDDELKAASSLFDRMTWFIRIAYLCGVSEGLDIYEAAYNESELFVDNIAQKIEKMTSEGYSENVMRVSNFLKITNDIHPVPSIAVEAEEQLLYPRRITRRMDDGKITARLNEESCLEKLWRYENTGFEPDEILYRSNRPHVDLMKNFEGEKPTGELAKTILSFQAILDKVYESAYEKGKKAEREANCKQ